LRYFLEISYNGSNYHGWQKQENAHSVQAELEEKLAVIVNQKLQVVGSGRTDTGVHAKQQYAHFDLDFPFTDPLLFRLNCILPRDIAVKNAFLVKDTAHARFDAFYREYEYVISKVKNPFLQGFSWEFTKLLSVSLMNEATQALLQNEDFESFSKTRTNVNHYRCKISKAIWREEADKIVFTIGADRFLRGMVRAIVGTMINVGLGKIIPEKMDAIIRAKARAKAGSSAPPSGLFLTKVHYPLELFLKKDREPLS